MSSPACLVASRGECSAYPRADFGILDLDQEMILGGDPGWRGDAMAFGVEWRLVGREGQHIDQGEVEGDFPDRPSALRALHAYLLHSRSRAGIATEAGGDGGPRMPTSRFKSSYASPPKSRRAWNPI